MPLTTTIETATWGHGPRVPLLSVRPIEATRHAAVADRWGLSFLQLPEWARVKAGWEHESLGWFDADGGLVGVALVLYRRVPRSRRCLAYLPEGPALPWAEVAKAPDAWLGPLVAHLRAQQAFAIRIGPAVPLREWSAATAKRGLADPAVSRLAELPPDRTDDLGTGLTEALAARGWRPLGLGDGFAAGQPRYVVRVDLADAGAGDAAGTEDPVEPGTEDPDTQWPGTGSPGGGPAGGDAGGGDPRPPRLWSGLNQEWRRNVKRAERAGVVVRLGDETDLPAFHALYRETAERDGFTPRPASYFTGMWHALNSERPRLRLYLAELDGEPLAAAAVVRVGGHVWYGYGASTSRRRDVRASNAVQWRALLDAGVSGAEVYDLRGIGPTLDPEAPLAGLLRFKLGIGGTVRESCGEWELTLSRPWAAAFRAYLRARS
jgi:lipid II:glycine glycyltransferase (peptidoglycan interpeptide bridge formation enzyme)